MTQSDRAAVEVNGIKFTPEMIEQMKGGEPLSGSISGGVALGEASTITPRTSTPISGYGTELRPNIAGNRPNEGLVKAPNVSRYNQQEAERRLKALEEAERIEQERRELAEVTNPVKLNATLQALSRKVAKLERQLKEALVTIATQA